MGGRATLAGVPKETHTPLKSFRVSQELWDAAQVKAAEKGETVSDVLRRALERYVKTK